MQEPPPSANPPPAPKYWRSLEDRAGTAAPEAEFGPSGIPEGIDRRRFLEWMSAALAAAGVSGCTRQRRELIVPKVVETDADPAGKTELYATAMVHAGHPLGLLVKSREGRPFKIEGNPEHPASGLSLIHI